MILVLKDHPEVMRAIRAADPKYRKHKAILNVHDRLTLYGTYWEGGSRTSYYAVDLASGVCKGAPQYDPPQFGGPREAPRCAIPEGIAIVALGTFCGKPATATVTINPANAAKLIPA